MEEKPFKLLLHGIDTIQAAYYCRAMGPFGIDFGYLTARKESIRQCRVKNPVAVMVGNTEFLLQPYGTASGYPLVIENGDFKIEMGEFNKPNFFVTFRSEALWREDAFSLHKKLLRWLGSAGYSPYRKEGLSRVDFTFDYHVPEVDFTEDSFTSYSSKDSKHRADGRPQTFTFGKGDIVLRVYDKVAEIKEKSEKVWFYLLWEQDENVWRIEWQVRKNILKQFGIVTFDDLHKKQGDLLHYLASEHDTLRIPADDSNKSRWPLHPLWENLQERIGELNYLGVSRIDGKQAIIEERLTRMAISIYGYLKRIAAIKSLKSKGDMGDIHDTFEYLEEQIKHIHDPLIWKADVERRIKEMQVGVW